MKRLGIIVLMIYGLTTSVAGQAVEADFSLPSQACMEENVKLVDQSANADRLEWDMCQGDLSLSPSATNAVSLAGNITTGVDVVFDGTNWYGFITNQNDNSILRLSFGSSLSNTPAITNLGNISGKMNRPTDIKIISENGNWFGFVYGLQDPMISRIDFGNNLTNTTASINPVSAHTVLSGAGATNGGFDMLKDGNNWIIVLTNNTSFQVVRLSAINASPAPADILSGITNSFANAMGDVVLIKGDAAYYGYVVAFGNKTFQRLEFGASLFATPTITNLTSFLPAGPTPYGIDIGYDNGTYYVFISTLEGNLVTVNLGSDLSQSPVSGNGLGTLSALENTLKIKLIKNQTSWWAFAPSWSSTRLYRVSFPSPACEFPGVLTSQNPVVKFSTNGTKTITLRAFDANGSFAEKMRSLVVTAAQAPELQISSSGFCLSAATNFGVSASSQLATHLWQFGDTNTSTNAAPQHQYSAAGSYTVSLSVSAANGCSNFSTENVSIYAEPQPDFNLPAGVICTNGTAIFTNTTPDNSNTLTYTWYVDNVLAGSEKDLQYNLQTPGSKNIKLVATNVGCEEEVTKVTSSVQAGPAVDFSVSGACEGQNIKFTSTVTEPVLSYLWNFDDGAAAEIEHPQHTFDNPGAYNVKLEIVATNGCKNTRSKNVAVYTRPDVDFSIDPAPNACSGANTKFNDITTDPPDSDVTSWNWEFYDSGSTTASTLQHPQHVFNTAGTYLVSLAAATNFGCSASIQKNITIAQSPDVTISGSAYCRNVPASFTVQAANAASYYWEIGTAYYLTDKPVHTFTAAGNHTVKVTVTGNNGCVTVNTNTVTVPVPLIPDFSVARNCANHATVFTDLSSGSDPVVIREWTFSGITASTSSGVIEHTFPSAGNEQIKLKVQSQAGCSYTTTKNITVVPAPRADFTTTPESGATPLKVKFNNASAYSTSYQWTLPDGTVTTSTETSPTFTFRELGEHIIELTVANAEGCADKISRPVTVEPPLPDVDLKLISVSENADGSLKVIITVQNKGNTILENLPVTIDISGEVSIKEIVEEAISPSGFYNLVLSYAIKKTNGLRFLCAQADLENDMQPSGNRICTEFLQKTFIFSAYPNPVKSLLTIEWIGQKDKPVSIVLADAYGKTVFKGTTVSEAGLNSHIVNVEDLQAGIYWLTVKDGLVKKTQRIFVSPKN